MLWRNAEAKRKMQIGNSKICSIWYKDGTIDIVIDDRWALSDESQKTIISIISSENLEIKKDIVDDKFVLHGPL